MIPAIQIDDPTIWVGHPEKILEALGCCHYQLEDAELQVWMNQEWRAAEQAYDFGTHYLSYIEIEVWAKAVWIPLSCPYDDLYWFYILEGKFLIYTVETQQDAFEIPEHYYRMVYLPADKYRGYFTKGKHRLLYITYQLDTLTREATEVLNPDLPPIYAARNHLLQPVYTELLSQSDGSAPLITTFLTRQANCYLQRSLQVQELATKLIYFGYESLHIQKRLHRTQQEWNEAFIEFIQRCIEVGDPINITLLSKKMKISVSYARKIFHTCMGVNLGHYIVEQKLLHSQRLLKKGVSIRNTAYHLNMSYQHFVTIFKKKFAQSAQLYSRTQKDLEE